MCVAENELQWWRIEVVIIFRCVTQGLGPQRHHTVYEGEGIGILLGTKLMEK